MKQAKRILKIELQRIDDPDPDTSYLGEYSNTAEGEFSIDRAHDLDCRINLEHIEDTEDDFGKTCTCDGGKMVRNEYRYFNPGHIEPFNPEASWIPQDRELADKKEFWGNTMRENARKDYDRMESLHRCDWNYIGIKARAEIVIGDVCQTITSGGLWGIESDSGEPYLRETEQEQLRTLRGILHELGFSRRAIATAVKSIEH